MKTRIAYVDGLRALAVALVVADHLAWHWHGLPSDAMAPLGGLSFGRAGWHLLLEGSHGVDLFFVLSGFCLSYPFLLELAHTGRVQFDAAHFFAKRIVRILPPYYAALLIFGIPRIVQHYASAGDLLRQALLSTLNTSSINEAFWTLAVEFRWYLCFPLILWLWIRSPRLFWLLMTGAVVLFNLRIVPMVDAGTLAGFMLGIVAADAQIRSHPLRRYALPAALALLPIAVFGERLFLHGSDSAAQSIFEQTQFTWQLAAFAFVVAAGYHRALRRALSSRAAVLVGVASYSIYLTHAPIAGGLAQRFAGWGFAEYAAVAGSTALLVGIGFWWYIERPFASGELKRSAVDALRKPLARAMQLLRLTPSPWLDPSA